MKTYITYLLHADTKDGPQHYVGSTDEERFDKRMHEHSLGNGSPKTRRWHLEQCHVYCAKTWRSASRECEYQYHREPNLAAVCPCCSPQLPLEPWSVHKMFRLDRYPVLVEASKSF